jgi:sulfotransferase
MKAVHFISGMPRSGSTLLCNILAQNPRFHCTHTSGCMDVLFGVRNSWDKLIEHRAHPEPQTKKAVLRAILNAYYANIEKPVVLDKCRGWVAYIEMAEEILAAKAKILVPIRPLPDILASMERLHRETSKTRQPPAEAENYFQFQTQEGRCEYWCQGSNVVGLAHNRIKDAVQRGFRDRMHLVKFDELTRDPAGTLQRIYEFLGETPFKHDFDNVEQVTQEDDSLHGYVDLHTIKRKVVYTPSRAAEIIGRELVKKYQAHSLDL